MRTFAIKLKLARQKCEMTQKDVAELLSIPLKTYQKYECVAESGHREPEQEMLTKIALALNTTTDFLLGLRG